MNWTLLIAALTVLISVVTYVMTRRWELAWKRTEFIVTQAQYFDNDDDLLEVVRILEDRHPVVNLAMIFDEASEFDPQKRAEYKQKCDKMFNFLWRLCYAYDQVGTLSHKEVEGFGWYFWRIAKFPDVVAYLENNGYEDINTVTKKLKLDLDDKDAVEQIVGPERGDRVSRLD
jgi:hypothetical protein